MSAVDLEQPVAYGFRMPFPQYATPKVTGKAANSKRKHNKVQMHAGGMLGALPCCHGSVGGWHVAWLIFHMHGWPHRCNTLLCASEQ